MPVHKGAYTVCLQTAALQLTACVLADPAFQG